MAFRIEYGGAYRPGHLAALMAVALAVFAPGTVFAQLTDEDIAALQARAESEGWTFTVGRNGATEYSLEQLCGTVEPADWRDGAPFVDFMPLRDLPSSYDWRLVTGCPPIRNQEGCGSCWAFALTGSVECNIVIKDSMIADLSEQWLVSCTGLGGCSGEWPGNAANYYLCSGQYADPCGGYGAVWESDFPYVAWDAPCGCPYEHPYCLDGWAFIGPEWGTPTIESIKQAILEYGPVTVCVYANAAFQAYTGGIFDACEDVAINHAVVLVGWDDEQGTDGVWVLRNSWGPNWGNSGYMKIEYGCSRIGYNALFVDYAGVTPTIAFAYPDGRPALLNPGEATTFRVNVVADGGTPVPDTGQLHYSLNGAAYETASMIQTLPNEYEATLPPADCYDIYNWYVSAEEQTAGQQYDPEDAAATTYSSAVLTGEVTLFADDFETDTGWTVSGDAADGGWDRGVPIDCDRGDPPSDHDGSGQCYLTDNSSADGCNSDVDGGYTYLISPTIDLSTGDGAVHYCLWYTNDFGADPDNDLFKVYVSNNDGADWTLAETIGPVSPVGWNEHTFTVGDFVTPTAQVKVRFEASDLSLGSVVEAGIDAFSVAQFGCQDPDPCFGDLDGDNDVDLADLAGLLGNYGMTGAGYADGDLDADGDVDLADLAALLGAYGTAC